MILKKKKNTSMYLVQKIDEAISIYFYSVGAPILCTTLALSRN